MSCSNWVFSRKVRVDILVAPSLKERFRDFQLPGKKPGKLDGILAHGQDNAFAMGLSDGGRRNRHDRYAGTCRRTRKSVAICPFRAIVEAPFQRDLHPTKSPASAFGDEANFCCLVLPLSLTLE